MRLVRPSGSFCRKRLVCVWSRSCRQSSGITGFEDIYADSDVTLDAHTHRRCVDINTRVAFSLIVVTTSQAAERWPNKRSSMVGGATVVPARQRI